MITSFSSIQNSLNLSFSLENDLNNFVILLQSEKRIMDPLSQSVLDLLDSIDSFKKTSNEYLQS